jgi:tetratricopeptide (TPR) repeat protein
MLQNANQGEGLLMQWLGRAIDGAAARACPGLTLEVVEELIDAAESNDRLVPQSSASWMIRPLLGRVAIARGDGAAALGHFDTALAARPEPDMAAGQSALLASAGLYEQAISHLDHFAQMNRPSSRLNGMRAIHEWVLRRQGYWPSELASLRRRLLAAQSGEAVP